MHDSWDFAEGDEIIPGRLAFQLLGGGHDYEAYLAWDEKLFTPVVVKAVRPGRVDDRITLRGIEREARALRRLSHPVIVRAFDAVLEGPRPHLVLENLDGPRLSTLLRKYGPIALEQLLPLALEICSALHYLATEDTVHLDVKPSNIIMGAPPRLIDLSIARTVVEAADLDHVVGTDAYMAPEQCDPPTTGRPGPPADIWGLGATLFEACAGYRPFARGVADDDAPAELRWPQLTDHAAALPRSVPDLIAKPIMTCLDPDPAARPAAAELAHELEPLVAALPKPVLGGFKPKLR